METWVVVLMLFAGDGHQPAITNIPLGISSKEVCDQIVKQWQAMDLNYKKVGVCLKLGEIKL